MTDKIIETEVKDVTNETKIEVDPAILLDSIDEVNALVDSHVKILTTVKDLIQKYVKAGMKHDEAASVALTLHKRAADKARDIVPNSI